MKEIKAYIRPNMLDKVIDAITALPQMPGLTISEVRGWGRPKSGGPPKLTNRIKLEIVVPDDHVDNVVNCIMINARTGKGHFGDGKIFVYTLDNAIRIRDGAHGKQVVQPKINKRVPKGE